MSLFEAGAEVGRYTLLGKLATGGMSEIYLARQAGPSGFTKVVVLKVILPHLASDANFMRMFTNEAKLAALLNHPNVVQIFDYGEEQGLPYMAMEYIDGRNLNRIGKALVAKADRYPRAIALRIVCETCGALEYAHGLCDSAGDRVGLIHRDVSRENILVTYSGQVKLVDFGVAKASFLESYTTEGTLKGKYAYMAPEMIRGEEPDHRLDLYALGVVLYALLSSRLPYLAKNHAQILQQILHEPPPPPSELDPSVPAALDQIVLRAMHKDKAERYQHASELRRELEVFLAEHERPVTSLQLSDFMRATFPPGADRDRETYQSLTGATPASQASPTSPTPGKTTPTPSKRAVVPAPAESPISLSEAGLTPNHRPLLIAIVAVLTAAAVLFGVILLWKSDPPVPSVDGRAPRTIDAKAPRAADGGRLRADSAAVAAARADSRAPKPDARAKAVHAAAQVGLLWVEAPLPGEVMLGKARLGPLPLAKKPVPVGTHRFEVRSEKLGYRMNRQVKVTAGSQHRLRFAPQQGTIQIFVNPWAKVTLDGKLLGVTPLKPVKVYEGPHQLLLENSELKRRQLKRVQVKPGETTVLKISLEQR